MVHTDTIAGSHNDSVHLLLCREKYTKFESGRRDWSKAESFLNLPTGVLSEFLLPFLKMKDIVFLDSAVTNCKLREEFQRCFTGTSIYKPRALDQFQWFANRGCIIQRLNLTKTHTLMLSSVVWDSRWGLQELRLSSLAVVPATLLTTILRECKLLKTLKLSFDKSDWQSVQIDTTLSLTKIDVLSNPASNIEFMIRLLEHSPKLEILILGTQTVTPRILHTCATHNAKLKELCLSPAVYQNAPAEIVKYDAAVREVLCKCTKLTTLKARLMSTGGIFQQGAIFTALKHVTLDGHGHNGLMHDAAVLQMVQSCPHIETLSLYSISEATDASLQAVAIHLPRLQSLTISSLPEITVAGVAAVRVACMHLSTLSVANCRRVTGTCFATGPRSLLTDLCLEVTDIDEDIFVTCALHNTSLRAIRIFLDYHWDVVDVFEHQLSATIFSRAAVYMKNLQRFEFYGYENACFNDAFMCALAQYCTNLTTLQIPGNQHITRSGFIALSQLHQLERLGLCECTKLDNKLLTAIAKGCPHLRDIHIQHGHRISNPGFCALAKHCRKLQFVCILGCTWLRDYSVLALLRNAHDLRYVRVQKSRLLSTSLQLKLDRMYTLHCED